ncbi:MAG: aspartate/glutamate racemase family protein [Proteobacteria bacterium]|jgi:Asp/Glu/hydantoin racemase|nr:aspartate/glutamate racemase family protein [Pseudomonadota bacterium]
MNHRPVTSAKGGKTVYGSTVGMLMLDTVFPRIPGDFGNAVTWPFPVLYRVVRGASPDRVVRHRAEGLLDAFIDTGKALVADGADGLSTTCGFLSLFQEELTRAVNVPVASSSLMQVPLVQKLLPPDQQVGVITISRESLTAEHLLAAGAPQDTPMVGTENGREFTRVILEDEQEMDVDACRQDLLDAGAELVREHPQVGAIVLECTNMGPHAADLRQQLGLPIFSIITFVSWFQSGLLPRRFSGITDDPR